MKQELSMHNRPCPPLGAWVRVWIKGVVVFARFIRIYPSFGFGFVADGA